MAFVEVLKRWTYVRIAREISRITRYADRLVQLDTLRGDTGLLRSEIRAPQKSTLRSADLGQQPPRDAGDRAVFLLNGNFNASLDIQTMLETCGEHLSRSDRVVVVVYNYYLAWVFRLADRLGLRNGPPSTTFVTRTNLAQLALHLNALT